MGVDNGGNSNRGNRNTPNRFPDSCAARCRQSRRRNIGTHVNVDYDGSNDVQGCICDLKEGKCLWPVIGVFEFCDDAEKDRMACWKEILSVKAPSGFPSCGFLVYSQNAPAMLVTARKAGEKPSDLKMSIDPLPIGFSMATSMTVIRTATTMDTQACES